MYRLNLRLDAIKESSREFLDGYERVYLDSITKAAQNNKKNL